MRKKKKIAIPSRSNSVRAKTKTEQKCRWEQHSCDMSEKHEGKRKVVSQSSEK
jgi:hypothetical protein